jgi:phenylalanyl-tRNA synthetase beta chain
MIETGLQVISYNINRKNADLRFFEYGKTYHSSGPVKYAEKEHLCIYLTGNRVDDSWNGKSVKSDFYYLKGVVNGILQQAGVSLTGFTSIEPGLMEYGIQGSLENTPVLQAGLVSKKLLDRFDIKQPVFFADISWEVLLKAATANRIKFRELPRQLPVNRDLSIIVPSGLAYEIIENTVKKIKLQKLKNMQLFDIFESEKLGAGKKSMAVSFTFLDEEKTLNDKEIDGMMQRIMASFESELQAEIRKQ